MRCKGTYGRRGNFSAYFGSALLVALLSPGASAHALHCHRDQDESLSTERPTFTNSSSVVPCRSLQIESGFLISTEHEQRGYDAPEGLLRFGLTKSDELRFTLPDYFQNYSSNGNFATGIGDLGIGVKRSLAATSSGFNLAGIFALTFPTGAQSVSSHGYDPTIQILPSQNLAANVSIATMLSVAWPTQGGSRNTIGQSSVVLDWQVKKPLDVFAEYSGSFPSTGTPQHISDFGVLYRPSRRQQVDFWSGFGLSAAAIDHFVGVGYSVRFDL
ncbi:MAG TPA: transporter [Silvibacterium sp.]|nr:transporter [Silvibacterium sp.]